MVELKFRLYDKLDNKMIYDEAGLSLMMSLDGDYSVAKLGETGWKSNESKYYEIMQYIGRKDKNNKDIYVDDYVRCITNLYDISYDEILPIIWRENSLQFDTEHGVSLELLNQNEIEVVGNIYENEELLND